MEYRKFGRHYFVRLDRGEEILNSIKGLCKREEIRLGSVVGLGAADHVSMGLFDVKEKVYHKRELDFPMEITSLTGNISEMDGEVYLHFHINVCDRENHAYGGHLNECLISATGELVITKIDGIVEREFSGEVGLNLYKFLP